MSCKYKIQLFSLCRNENILNLQITDSLGRISALVLQAKKKINDKRQTEYREKVLNKCGCEIYSELNKVTNLSLSDCFITGAHHFSQFDKIIHSVYPKYSKTFENSCDSSLHQALRNVFDISLKNGIRSLCFGSEMIQPANDYPVSRAITVVCRTFRKCMEKFGDRFDKILICIEQKELLEQFKAYFKLYFPRNFLEEACNAKFHAKIELNEYGDVIRPERLIQVKTEFILKNQPIAQVSHNSQGLENLEKIYFNEEGIESCHIYKSDKQRMRAAVKASRDYAKMYYNKKIKYLTGDIYDWFEEMQCISFKGTDSLKRQIFFVYLESINFNELDDGKLTDAFIIYLQHYIRQNLKSANLVSLIVFCRNVRKQNFPSSYFVETLEKILNSNSIKSISDMESYDIILMMPSLMFRLYLQYLRFYINNTIWSHIKYLDSYAKLNEQYDFDIDESIEEMRAKQIEESRKIKANEKMSSKMKEDEPNVEQLDK